MAVDRIDAMILEMIQENGEANAAEVALRLNLSSDFGLATDRGFAEIRSNSETGHTARSGEDWPRSDRLCVHSHQSA